MKYIILFFICTFSASAGKSEMDSILLNLRVIETEAQFKAALEKWNIEYVADDAVDGKKILRSYLIDSCYLRGLHLGRGLFNFQLDNKKKKKTFRLNEFIVSGKLWLSLLPRRYWLFREIINDEYGEPTIKGPMLELDVFDWEAETLFVKYPVDRTMWQVLNKFVLSLTVDKESVTLLYFLK